MIATLAQGTLLIGVVLAALFCLVAGMSSLPQKQTWFNQPEILLGIGLIFFALLNITILSFTAQSLDKFIAVPCLIILFLSLAFFLLRSLLLFVKNFS